MDNSDDNTESSVPLSYFASFTMLRNGTTITVIFGSTSDASVNQQISAKLKEAVIKALNIASQYFDLYQGNHKWCPSPAQ